VISFLLGGLIINPFLPWFSATVIAVAAFTAFVTCKSAQTLRNVPATSTRFVLPVLGYGVLTGAIAAIISAPVVVYLFGGVTGSGSALLVAFFLKTGHQLLQAALLSGFTAEPIDKTLQLLFAVILFRATPESFINVIRRNRAS
jgi:energy-coupling factor transport system substrate-specific component